MPDSSEPKILVMGVGNPLMGDEGVGPRVVEHLLTNYCFPSNVNVVDAGTMGFTILNLFQGTDVVVVVDAVRGTGHEPGTVLGLTPENMAPNQVMHSLHDARLPDVLDAARLMGLDPDVECVGVQINEITAWEVELSPAVEAAVPYAADAVIDALSNRGIAVTTAAESGTSADADATVDALRTLRTKSDQAT